MSARRRRRSTTNELVTIFWRDIPAQVTTTVNGDKGSWLLDQRFQVAIDVAATVAGLTDADDYVLEWRRVAEPFDGDAETGARSHAEKLQDRYPPERVRALVANGGLEPESEAS